MPALGRQPMRHDNRGGHAAAIGIRGSLFVLMLGRTVMLVVLASLATTAAAQTPQRPVPAKPDPAFEAARAVFEAWPEAERRAVQDALVWTGDFASVITGGFGRRTYEAIMAYRTRTGLAPGGGVEGPDRAALLSAGEAARRAARFRVQTDPASGASLGVPERLLSRRSPLPGGTRWQSADGRATLDTRSFPAGGTSLDALFAKAAAASPGRTITYILKKPDFVVVTGETATGRFYIRYAAGPAGIRGFALGYDKTLAGEIDRLVIAVANSFVPFPEPAPGAGPSVEVARPPPTPANASPAARATGLAVSPGLVLTSAAALEGCRMPRVGGGPARPGARDVGGALLLLGIDGASGVRAAIPAIRTGPPGPDESVAVLGADATGASLAPGMTGPGGLTAPLQPGGGGAPVLDRSGRLVGLVARMPASPGLVSGVLPPARYALVPGGSVSAFLAANGIDATAREAGAAETFGAAAAPVLAGVVAITCGG